MAAWVTLMRTDRLGVKPKDNGGVTSMRTDPLTSNTFNCLTVWGVAASDTERFASSQK